MSKVDPTYKDNSLDATPLADSGINKRLIKWHSLIDESAILLFALFSIKYLIPQNY